MAPKVDNSNGGPGRVFRPGAFRNCEQVRWDWLLQAHRVGGAGLIVGLVLLDRCTRDNAGVIDISVAQAARCADLYWTTARRAFIGLENAGLIAVERRMGRSSIVTLVTHPKKGIHANRRQVPETPVRSDSLQLQSEV